MKQTAATNLSQETKLCFYWGMALGTIIGLALGLQNAYFSNAYIQKNLTNVVLEIFSGRLILSVIGVTTVLLILMPAISFLSRSVSAIVDIRLSRLATVMGDVHVDPAILLQSVALAVAAALIAGIYPAYRMARISPAEALRED